jgi:hypothetical protein
MRLFVALVFLFATGSTNAENFSVHDLVFLTQDGCVNTARMKSRLDDALKSLKLPTNYQLVDVGKLDASDLRTGYGTPTVLYNNRDLFGKQRPARPDVPS